MTSVNTILNVMLPGILASGEPLNKTGDKPLVITYSFAGNSQPSTFPATSLTLKGWRPFTKAEKARVVEAMEHIEQYVNVEFRETTKADPDLDFGLVAMSGTTVGYGSFTYSYYDPKVVYEWDSYALWDKAEFGGLPFSTILHEIGHAMGLRHPFDDDPDKSKFPTREENSDKYTIMAYNKNPDTGKDGEGLGVYDILALQSSWGAAKKNGGDSTYTAKSGVIWDTGGTDTLDGRGAKRGAKLDLREGAFSSIKSKDDVVIAFDVDIERALGSRRADTIIGNDLGNLLRAGRGNDTVKGGDGNDRLLGEQGNDKLYGNDDKDKIYGDSGRDRLEGGVGNDLLSGGADDDKLFGQAGNDRLDGGRGDDVLVGGPGEDKFLYKDGGDRDVISDYTPGEDTIKIIGQGRLAIVENAMSQVGRDVVFRFGNGDTLTVENAQVDDISNDLIV